MKTVLSMSVLLLSASAFAGGVGTPVVAKSPTFRSVACPDTVKASQCGYLSVPLDHAQPQGQQIELFVAVRKASDQVPAADPLFYLEGGPKRER